ncbi:hypothetical protein ACJJTC_005346, partial [Scirpophaga incertulas]
MVRTRCFTLYPFLSASLSLRSFAASKVVVTAISLAMSIRDVTHSVFPHPGTPLTHSIAVSAQLPGGAPSSDSLAIVFALVSTSPSSITLVHFATTTTGSSGGVLKTG